MARVITTKNGKRIIISERHKASMLVSTKERNPEESGEYLCLTEHGHYQVLLYSKNQGLFNASDNLDKAHNERYAIRVDYWMKLPEKPKGV